ncbi:MAG: (2Fe-2S)-binding protein [candidate division WOR-3 bacterium]
MVKKRPKIVCRCEGIEEKEVMEWIKRGYRTPEELKRILRIGMGHCQGRTCFSLLVRLISRETKIPPREIKLPKRRSPLKPVPIRILAHFRDEKP